jgi:hypothetical protein
MQVLESGLPVRRSTNDGSRSEAELGPVSDDAGARIRLAGSKKHQ